MFIRVLLQVINHLFLTESDNSRVASTRLFSVITNQLPIPLLVLLVMSLWLTKVHLFYGHMDYGR